MNPNTQELIDCIWVLGFIPVLGAGHHRSDDCGSPGYEKNYPGSGRVPGISEAGAVSMRE